MPISVKNGSFWQAEMLEPIGRVTYHGRPLQSCSKSRVAIGLRATLGNFLLPQIQVYLLLPLEKSTDFSNEPWLLKVHCYSIWISEEIMVLWGSFIVSLHNKFLSQNKSKSNILILKKDQMINNQDKSINLFYMGRRFMAN